MRKIFLDCGSDTGESVDRFRELFKDSNEYEIYCFEPHPKSIQALEKYGLEPNITVINKACWIHNKTIDFFKAGVSPAGSTLLKDKTTWHVSRKPITVPCVHLSNWISKQFKPEDYIVLKMNIEGAEYDILEDMINNKTISLINKLYISFHFRKIPSITKKRHLSLISDIEKSGHTIMKWW